MYTQLSHYERERIGLLRAERVSIPIIALKLGRHPSTIRRELRRLGPRTPYSPLRAQKDARKRRQVPRTQKKLDHESLWLVVQSKLKLKWSPEQIAQYLKGTYAESTMHVAHETITNPPDSSPDVVFRNTDP